MHKTMETELSHYTAYGNSVPRYKFVHWLPHIYINKCVQHKCVQINVLKYKCVQYKCVQYKCVQINVFNIEVSKALIGDQQEYAFFVLITIAI